jgi:hypothetical protein
MCPLTKMFNKLKQPTMFISVKIIHDNQYPLASYLVHSVHENIIIVETQETKWRKPFLLQLVS